MPFELLDQQDRLVTMTLEPRLLDFDRQVARELPGGFRYLRFDSFSFANLRWLSAELKAHRAAPGVVVDLRQNLGGMVAANSMAAGILRPA